jgi:hypothetical protein
MEALKQGESNKGRIVMSGCFMYDSLCVMYTLTHSQLHFQPPVPPPSSLHQLSHKENNANFEYGFDSEWAS